MCIEWIRGVTGFYGVILGFSGRFRKVPSELCENMCHSGNGRFETVIRRRPRLCSASRGFVHLCGCHLKRLDIQSRDRFGHGVWRSVLELCAMQRAYLLCAVLTVHFGYLESEKSARPLVVGPCPLEPTYRSSQLQYQ